MNKKKIIKIIIGIIILVLMLCLIPLLLYKINYKENHQLLLTILSDGGNDCGYVKLEFYDDNTYAFYDELEYKESSEFSLGTIDYSDRATVGIYKYDILKLESSIKNSGPIYSDNAAKYTLIFNNESTKYFVNADNEELKELLNSAFLQAIRANLNNCPKYK